VHFVQRCNLARHWIRLFEQLPGFLALGRRGKDKGSIRSVKEWVRREERSALWEDVRKKVNDVLGVGNDAHLDPTLFYSPW
jgi:hypothetical protein